MFENRGPHIADGDYAPLSAVDIFVKDLGIVVEEAGRVGLDPVVAARALEQFRAASAAGWGRDDDFGGREGLRPRRRHSPAREAAGMILGAIGDDFTGSSDLALMLAKGGMRTVQYVGVPDAPADASVEAGVVALKSRSIPAAEAVALSLAALAWLRAQGCRQFFFKYCSTFDSTPEGNIGPVIDALIDALGTEAPVLVCPAFPGDRAHRLPGAPLRRRPAALGIRDGAPPADADDRPRPAALARPARPGGRSATCRSPPLRGDARAALLAEAAAGRQVVVADAVEDADLRRLAEASAGFELLTGGSGLALGLPEVHGATGARAPWHGEPGPALALSGSARAPPSRRWRGTGPMAAPGLKIEAADVLAGRTGRRRSSTGPPPRPGCRWSIPPIRRRRSPRPRPRRGASGRRRRSKASSARWPPRPRIGGSPGSSPPAARPPARWCRRWRRTRWRSAPRSRRGCRRCGVAGRPLVLALKSGNFGQEDFFARAAAVLGAP